MFVIATAAAIAALSPNVPTTSVRASVQAQATVRIISGAVLRLSEERQGRDVPLAHRAVVHAEGSARLVRLIEFE